MLVCAVIACQIESKAVIVTLIIDSHFSNNFALYNNYLSTLSAAGCSIPRQDTFLLCIESDNLYT